MKPVLIAGPTASGKSALALAIAERDGGMVINADALQVYTCWRILTARPDPSEEARAPHRLYGHIPAISSYSTGQWLREVAAELATARTQNLRPIIVGGTGLNFTALTEGLADIPATPDAVRQDASARMAADGIGWFQDRLRRDDPATFANLDANNPMRLQRAWEVLHVTGKGMAAWHDETPPALLPLESVLAVALTPDPGWLNTRIATRFAQMINTGAMEEVRAWRDAGHASDLPSAKAIGRDALTALQDGHITRDMAVEQGTIATRQYAKRQRTWIRNRFTAWHQLVPEQGLEAMVQSLPG